MAIDNVQRFEILKRDADELQELAYTDTDPSDLSELLKVIDSSSLVGIHVAITDGMLESRALDENLEQKTVFVPMGNNEAVGQYQGLAWRFEGFQMPDGSSNVMYRVCHVVAGEKMTYIDDEGDHIEKTPIAYVTAPDSAVEIISPIGSHDYRELEDDAFTLRIDQVAMDDSVDLTERANRIAQLFRIVNTAALDQNRQKLYRQRISYLNSIGLFDDAVVISPYGVFRSENGRNIVTTDSRNFVAEVGYVALDISLDTQGAEEVGAVALSYEVSIHGIGAVSIPHIKGLTKIINIG
jgi:hypothetical protein